jgi:excinuclease UvrABC nuclease subunit
MIAGRARRTTTRQQAPLPKTISSSREPPTTSCSDTRAITSLSGDPFPQLRFHRGALDRRNRHFGPSRRGRGPRRHRDAAEGLLLRTCENTVFANCSRPRMLYQIQRCTAPCVGFIGEVEHRKAGAWRCSCAARRMKC